MRLRLHSCRAGRIILGIAVFALLAAQAACLRTYTRGGGIEPNYRPMEGRKYEVVGDASGESSSFYFLWLVPFTPEHRLEEALDAAMAEKGGDNLVGVKWSFERQYWILGTVNIIRAEGKAVRYLEE
jgi:hypothetical protein